MSRPPHSPRAVRGARSGAALAASLAAVLGGCVASGTATPDYVPDEPPQASVGPEVPVPVELGPEPDLGALLAAAEAHSPRLASARAALTAAEGRAWQSELWPNPRVSLEARDVPRDRMSLDEGQTWLVLTQPVSLSGRRGAAIDAAGASRASAADQLEAVRRSVFLDVVTAWSDVLLAQGLRDETAGLARIARREAELAEGRVASGSLAESEAYEVRVEAEQATNAERAAGREVEAALERLRSVVGATKTPVRVGAAGAAGPALPPRPEVRRLVFERGPALAALRRRVDAAAHRLSAERAARVPDVDVMVAIGRDDAMREGLAEAGVSFPLPVFDRNQGRIREAAAMLSDARSELARAQAELDAEIVGDVAAFEAAEDTLASWRDRLVPAAERAHAQIASAVASGTRPEIDGLAAERRLVEARIERLRAERERRRAEAEVRSHLPAAPAAGRGTR